MRINQNSNERFKRVLNQLAAEKKKTAIALCLITVMVFMWCKVISGKGPTSAQAAVTRTRKPEQQKSKLKVTFVELPIVEGRNDVLTRDFFKVNGENFGNAEEVNVISKGNKSDVKRIIEKLKLEAISVGGNPEAFINNKLLSIGDVLPIRDGNNTYECEIVSIEENVVLVKCLEAEIELKLTPVNVVD